jgi:hypothetical protein
MQLTEGTVRMAGSVAYCDQRYLYMYIYIYICMCLYMCIYIGSVTYCDQRYIYIYLYIYIYIYIYAYRPWILNTTVKDNILFGKPFNEALFDRAIHASSLEDDIKVSYI